MELPLRLVAAGSCLVVRCGRQTSFGRPSRLTLLAPCRVTIPHDPELPRQGDGASVPPRAEVEVRPPLRRAALRKLLLVDAAEVLKGGRVPPGNRLEKLAGDREGQYSIRINDQWRMCFRWEEAARTTSRSPITIEKLPMARRSRPGPPGRDPVQGVPGPARPQPVSAGQEDERATAPDQRDRPRAACHHRGHGVAAGRCFGTSEQLWLNLQVQYDLEIEKDRLGNRLQRDVKVRAAAHRPRRAQARTRT